PAADHPVALPQVRIGDAGAATGIAMVAGAEGQGCRRLAGRTWRRTAGGVRCIAGRQPRSHGRSVAPTGTAGNRYGAADGRTLAEGAGWRVGGMATALAVRRAFRQTFRHNSLLSALRQGAGRAGGTCRY